MLDAQRITSNSTTQSVMPQAFGATQRLDSFQWPRFTRASDVELASVLMHAPTSDKILTQRGVGMKLSIASQAPHERWFHDCLVRWKSRPRFLSMIDSCLRDDYQQIIGLGSLAVPLILRELDRDLDHWFWALSAITHENPIPSDEEGDLEAMRKRWIAWGRERNFI